MWYMKCRIISTGNHSVGEEKRYKPTTTTKREENQRFDSSEEWMNIPKKIGQEDRKKKLVCNGIGCMYFWRNIFLHQSTEFDGFFLFCAFLSNSENFCLLDSLFFHCLHFVLISTFFISARTFLSPYTFLVLRGVTCVCVWVSQNHSMWMYERAHIFYIYTSIRT